LLLQLFRLALQLLRQLLRLLEQLLGAHVRLNHVQHDTDRFGELVEERLVDLAEREEARQLDDSLDLAFKQNRKDDDITGRSFAKAGRNLDVVVGYVLEENRLLFQRGLPDQSFAEREPIPYVLASAVSVARDELEQLDVRDRFLIGDEERAVMS